MVHTPYFEIGDGEIIIREVENVGNEVHIFPHKGVFSDTVAITTITAHRVGHHHLDKDELSELIEKLTEFRDAMPEVE